MIPENLQILEDPEPKITIEISFDELENALHVIHEITQGKMRKGPALGLALDLLRKRARQKPSEKTLEQLYQVCLVVLIRGMSEGRIKGWMTPPADWSSILWHRLFFPSEPAPEPSGVFSRMMSAGEAAPAEAEQAPEL